MAEDEEFEYPDDDDTEYVDDPIIIIKRIKNEMMHTRRPINGYLKEEEAVLEPAVGNRRIEYLVDAKSKGRQGSVDGCGVMVF